MSALTDVRDYPRSDDAELLRRIVAGDAEAFGRLYDRHAATAYSLARRICTRPQLAEDAVQEAFLQLWRDAGTFRFGEGAPVGWLLAIVRHRSLDLVRRVAAAEGRRHDDDDALVAVADVGPAPDEQTCTREREHVIASALSQLPELQRHVIELAYFDGLSQSQIGAQLGVPLGTVKSRARLGLQRLASDAGVLAFADAA